MINNLLAFILAGGMGERLSVLAQNRAKPAVTFGSKYRIIDFTLSNCVNSGIRNVAILTQYQPHSLIRHIGIGMPWGLNPPSGKVRLLQPFLTREATGDWYKGTADAVYQNIFHMEEQNPEMVFILSGDHIYKMNYADMQKLHRENGADVTLAITPMPAETLHHFGTVVTDERGRVTGFEEKVKRAKSNLVSMGVYLFNPGILKTYLTEDARDNESHHDFGKNVLPRMVKDKCNIFAYTFSGYWRDVGSVQAYWQTNMDLLESLPGFLSDESWPIFSHEEERPPTIISNTASISNSMISDGCIIDGVVEHSVLSSGVRVAGGAIIKDSIIMSDSFISYDSVVDRSIIDKEVIIGDGCRIGTGEDPPPNRREHGLTDGITLVGKRARVPSGIEIGRNCVVFPGAAKDDFPGMIIPSGETVKSSQPRPIL
ncbi:MAG: glucose-1-phosphate adenylyltransferase [Dehalococcoidales bacterium]|nr:glucose-1-phosphate adenylyltransferase [Dehalococcoidales bacterium]